MLSPDQGCIIRAGNGVSGDCNASCNLRNKGAAFSFLANFSYRLQFFILVSLVAIGVIVSVFARLRPEQRLTAFSLSLIFSGELGNLSNRVRLGEGLDFLDV